MATKRVAPKQGDVADERDDELVFRNKRRLMMKEANAFGLSKSKVVYANSEYNQPNIIIRSVDDMRFSAFPCVDLANMKRVFYGILSLLDRNRVTFLERSKFGVQALSTLLKKLSEQDRVEMNKFPPNDAGDSIFITSVVNVRVSDGDVPQIALLKYGIDEDGDSIIVCGIYLFTNEVVKLVKYMNKLHKHSDTRLGNCGSDPSKKFNELSDIELLQ